ncbi:MAG: efflux RND transporter periplasmic adaptor subunit [Balneolaceae bacterium]|nr:MAG: efflux RND transporter periplasmic adaptor subunit [Balneolaceae bacterium]
MSKQIKKILTAVLLLAVIGGLAYPKVKPLFGDSSAQESAASGGPSVIAVDVVELEYEVIEDRIFSSGTVQANELVELSAEASGIITEILFEEGSEVNRGQLLVKINDSELQAQKQRSVYRLTLAEQREERQRRLLDRGGISQDDYDATLNELNVLRAEEQLIQAQIEKTEIRAPFSGRIGLKYVSTGAYITPATRIASLQEVDPVKIDFSIPERFISRVTVGDRIEFSVQGVDSTFTGEVYAIEPRIDTQTRTLQIRALSSNPENRLFPGAFANIVLIMDQIGNALMVPAIAVIPELNSQRLFIVRDGRVERRTVQTGIRTSDRVQILDGLQRGDLVLTTGLLQVREGMEVEIGNRIKSTEL